VVRRAKDTASTQARASSAFPFSDAIHSRAPRIGLALLAAVATTGLALAQETKEEIIVTGSRIARSGLFWAINNLLDKAPPVAPGGNAFPTNPVFFDTIGRRIRAGVRLNF
jgi:hypothetical protein